MELVKLAGKMFEPICTYIYSGEETYQCCFFWNVYILTCNSEKLESWISTERDRRYIVCTLATMLLASIPRPTMSDCAIPAKAIIQTYPFLADISVDGRESHVS